ncbi:Trehalose-6-phosphate phosphatase [Rubellimicrobium mesophilum DSM 19309]|uniref:Trehalose 6-phosphate phosphatase n=1 Tax=Rubellimicrobium mesophilum DSM 19309 TaxID=442562 RepID=A0A017HK75_9RHOB|nr:trehalose-phosphatase [Rubellimicrobium mesophilum]EYD74766.1 Trehalose-6-phosphate phosphatase [Rubellimicrobium mesophilum DSM 19309]
MTLGDLEGFRLGPGDALFLDFDGTLAEIGPDPDAIWLPEPTCRDLERLGRRLGGALAILSGRDLRDLARRTPAEVWRLGGHGLEVLPPGMEPPPSAARVPEAVLAALANVARRPGVRLEVKGPMVAVHYRAAPGEGPACVAAAEAAARAVPGHVAQAGKMVVEVKPEGAHKGTALRRLMGAPPFAGRRPVMMGDDATDEDAMSAALALGGVAIKVGAGETVAFLRAPDPRSVRSWLEREASAAWSLG